MNWLRCAGMAATISSVLAYGQGVRAQVVPVSGKDRFSGSVRAQATYDSNVAGGNGAVASLRNIQPRDEVYDLGGTINLQLPSARRTVFLTATADVLRHQRNSNLDAENYLFSAGAALPIGSCGATAIATFNRLQSQIQDLSLPVTANINEQQGANASLSCGRGNLIVGAAGGFIRSTNSATGSGFLTSESTTASTFVGYKNKSLGDLTIGAQYNNVDYPDPPLVAGRSLSGFKQLGGNISYTRKIGLRLSGTAGVSYQSLEASTLGGGASINTSNFGSNVALNYRFSPRLGLNLTYILANDASPTTNATYVRNQSFKLAGDYTLNSRLSAHMSVSTADLDYRGGLPTATLQLRRSKETSVSGGAALKVGRKISITLDAIHVDRNADVAQFSYGSDQVRLGVSSSF